MLQLRNHSPFEAVITLFPNEQGIQTLYVTVKATFRIGPELAVAEKQVPPILADHYWLEPGSSSVRYGSDVHLTKPSTDVVLNCRAWAPNGQKVPVMDIAAAVADRQSVIRVYGDRVWKNGSMSSPIPFDSMPVVYEFAFGGVHKRDNEGKETLAEGRNPIGRGFRGKRDDGDLEGMPLPNLEDPKGLVSEVGDRARPAGFGFIAPSWLPRRSFAGTYDESWQKGRAPYLPEDFDPRFFNAAHPDLTFDRFLEGGEPVMLDNLSRDGPLSFALPICGLETNVRIAGTVVTPRLNLETVLIEPDEYRLCMTWRAAVQCDKNALKIERVDVGLTDMQGVGG